MKKILFFLSSLALICVAHVASAAPTSTVVQNLKITQLGSVSSPCLYIQDTAGLVASQPCGGTGVVSVTSTADIIPSAVDGPDVGFTFASHQISQFGNDVPYAAISGALGAGDCVQAFDATTIQNSGVPCAIASGGNGVVQFSDGTGGFSGTNNFLWDGVNLNINSLPVPTIDGTPTVGDCLKSEDGGTIIVSAGAPCLTSAPTTTITASGTTLNGPAFTFGTSTTILPRTSGTAIVWDLVNTGNWAGTWLNATSGTYYPSSNPSGYISTSTFNLTGTSGYFIRWNAAGTGLTSTSSLSQATATANLMIGTTTTNPATLFIVGTTTLANSLNVGTTTDHAPSGGMYTESGNFSTNAQGTFTFMNLPGGTSVVRGNSDFQMRNGSGANIGFAGASTISISNTNPSAVPTFVSVGNANQQSTNTFNVFANSFLWSGSVSSTMKIVSSSVATATASLLQFGPNLIQGGNGSGTTQGANYATGFNSDWFNFQINSTTQYKVTKNGLETIYGTSTVTLGGSLLAAAGNCTSTAAVVPLALSTSTDVVLVTPQIYPGDGTEWNRATIDVVGTATSSVTIRVCADIAVTPTATKYNFTIQRTNGQ